MTAVAVTRTPETHLVLELSGASVAMPDDEFADYARERVMPMIAERDPEYLVTVVTLAMAMAGGVIEAWASDTDREPQEILNLMRKQLGNETGI